MNAPEPTTALAPTPPPTSVAASTPPPAADPAPRPPSTGAEVRGLTAEQLQEVVVAHRAALRACYDAQAQKSPGLRGDVTVAWTVDELGMVVAADVTDSTLRNDAVEECLVHQVRGWRFPNSDGETQATFPFTFGSTARDGCKSSVEGRLRPEAIRHIIKLGSGRFRQCYENGLLRNPRLSGRVTVRFVIDHSGRVTSPADDGSELPDAAVVACVVHALGELSFPQPEGGLVSVVYPFVFNPRD